MERATTPTTTAAAPPSTPNASANATSSPAMRVQRNSPALSTPGGHKRKSSVPHTPSASTLVCSSSPAAFTRVLVHTAKCSECDLRNKGTMLRCPGCTFQICKPCQDGRGKAERSLAHGNMLSPQVATPGSGGSVVRRKPTAALKSLEMEKEKGKEEDTNTEKIAAGQRTKIGVAKGPKRVVKPAPKPKPKSKAMARGATPSNDSSDEDFAPDPASPTSNKWRRTEITSKIDGASDIPSPFLKASDKNSDTTKPSLDGATLPEKSLRDMSTNELLGYHGVNTTSNPYTAHLLSRDELVVSNPVIQIPEIVKRGFKPRPTAEEIHKNIQDKVRERMGLPKLDGGPDGSA